jgi:hypothetical protein
MQGMMLRDARKGQFEWLNTIAPLLGDWVVLLAMKHRRAPLPVPSALWKGLLREGFPNDLDELAILARRYLFLGDARILLAELRIRTAATASVRETLSKEDKIKAKGAAADQGCAHMPMRSNRLTSCSQRRPSSDAIKIACRV